MPLIKIFTRATCELPSVEELVPRLRKIWAVPSHIMKVLVIHVDDWSESASEDVFIDVRAKRTEARTHDVVQAAVLAMGQLFESHELKANVRVELYEPSLQHSYQSGSGSSSNSGSEKRFASSSSVHRVASSASSAALRPKRIDRIASRLVLSRLDASSTGAWRALSRAAGGGMALQGEQILRQRCYDDWMRPLGELLTSVAFSWLMRTCVVAANAQLDLSGHSGGGGGGGAPRALLG